MILLKFTLRALRVEFGLSQSQEAKKIGCSLGTVANIESGKHKPSFNKVMAIINLYNVPLGKITLKPKLALKGRR